MVVGCLLLKMMMMTMMRMLEKTNELAQSRSNRDATAIIRLLVLVWLLVL
jgi:hypothetical protein